MFIKHDGRARKRHETAIGCMVVREEHGCKWRLVRFEIYTLPSSTYKLHTHTHTHHAYITVPVCRLRVDHKYNITVIYYYIIVYHKIHCLEHLQNNKIVTHASFRWQVKQVLPPPSYRCCLKSRNSLTEILFLFLTHCLSLPLATTMPIQCPKLDSSTTILRSGCTYLSRGGVTTMGIRHLAKLYVPEMV